MRDTSISIKVGKHVEKVIKQWVINNELIRYRGIT